MPSQTMSTYSIIGYDPRMQELGAALQSKFLAAGALVPWVEAKVGAIATQARTNMQYGLTGLHELKQGKDVEFILRQVIAEDPDYQTRQVGIIDARGNGVAFTGDACLPWAGHIVGEHFCCQGNCLADRSVLDAMADTYVHTKGDLADRLLKALEAAQYYGGDRRGQQSAALLVKSPKPLLIGNSDTLVDLRVDDHPQPVEELERLLQLHRVLYSQNHRDRYFPFEQYVEQQLLGLLKQIGFSDQHFQHDVSCHEVILRFAEIEGYSVHDVFFNNCINGEIVDLIVRQYYDKEYEDTNILLVHDHIEFDK
jgi:uncharacterized Ntn-hydrolase superfamily protein